MLGSLFMCAAWTRPHDHKKISFFYFGCYNALRLILGSRFSLHKLAYRWGKLVLDALLCSSFLPGMFLFLNIMKVKYNVPCWYETVAEFRKMPDTMVSHHRDILSTSHFIYRVTIRVPPPPEALEPNERYEQLQGQRKQLKLRFLLALN